MNNDTTQPCTRCDGEGSIHTGIDEAPTTQCPKCDGAGTAQPREQASDPIAEIQRLVAANDELRAINERLRAETFTRKAAPEAPTYPTFQHPDDSAVDRFAVAMKAKMAASRAKGRNGWDNEVLCPAERLQAMLVEHLSKGDPVDVGNFAMMLWNRGERVASTGAAPARDLQVILSDAKLRNPEYVRAYFSSVWTLVDELQFGLDAAGAAPEAPTLTIDNAPVGTLAPSIGGGRWYRTANGWKWNGPDGSAGTFPRPGGDWNGKLIAPLVPEVAASVRHISAATTVCAPNCFYGDCPPCVAAGLVPAAATTASASDSLCDGCGGNGKVWSEKYERKEACEACNGTGRATAPSRNAAPEVKTWQERIVSGAFHPDPLPSDESVMVYTGASAAIAARDAEITELRAALTQQSAAQAPANAKYEVTVDSRDLFDAIRNAWREGQSGGDCSGPTDTAENWHKATDYAEGAIKGWSTLRAAQASHAGADTERDAARYRVLRRHVAPCEVCFSMDVPATNIPPEQSIEERIDELCDAAMSAATEQGEKP